MPRVPIVDAVARIFSRQYVKPEHIAYRTDYSFESFWRNVLRADEELARIPNIRRVSTGVWTEDGHEVME